jgi:hypothetical protein
MKSPVDTTRLGVAPYCGFEGNRDRDATGGVVQRAHVNEPMDPGDPWNGTQVPKESSGPSLQDGVSLRETIRPTALR